MIIKTITFQYRDAKNHWIPYSAKITEMTEGIIALRNESLFPGFASGTILLYKGERIVLPDSNAIAKHDCIYIRVRNAGMGYLLFDAADQYGRLLRSQLIGSEGLMDLKRAFALPLYRQSGVEAETVLLGIY